MASTKHSEWLTRNRLIDPQLNAAGWEVNSQVNYGQAAAHELARSEVLDGFKGCQDVCSGIENRAAGDGWSIRRPTLEEGNRILQLLDTGLKDGALGIGSTVDRYPLCRGERHHRGQGFPLILVAARRLRSGYRISAGRPVWRSLIT